MRQAYEKQKKEELELIGDPQDKQFALSKSIGFNWISI